MEANGNKELIELILWVDQNVNLNFISIVITTFSSFFAVFGNTWSNGTLTKLGKWLIVVICMGFFLQLADHMKNDYVTGYKRKMAYNVFSSKATSGSSFMDSLANDSLNKFQAFKDFHHSMRNDLLHFMNRYKGAIRIGDQEAIEQFLSASDLLYNQTQISNEQDELLLKYKKKLVGLRKFFLEKLNEVNSDKN